MCGHRRSHGGHSRRHRRHGATASAAANHASAGARCNESLHIFHAIGPGSLALALQVLGPVLTGGLAVRLFFSMLPCSTTLRPGSALQFHEAAAVVLARALGRLRSLAVCSLVLLLRAQARPWHLRGIAGAARSDSTDERPILNGRECQVFGQDSVPALTERPDGASREAGTYHPPLDAGDRPHLVGAAVSTDLLDEQLDNLLARLTAALARGDRNSRGSTSII
mmetsp:Transcript_50653/g.121978  ORF Transcript_50653/g.121978 Transcript_50653/m.121978 type:complete len:224 (-) Transcript_50653:19-690(-)